MFRLIICPYFVLSVDLSFFTIPYISIRSTEASREALDQSFIDTASISDWVLLTSIFNSSGRSISVATNRFKSSFLFFLIASLYAERKP